VDSHSKNGPWVRLGKGDKLSAINFGDIGEWVTINPSSGIAIKCQCCDIIIARLVENNLVIAGRHHGNWHTTILSLLDLGYVKHE